MSSFSLLIWMYIFYLVNSQLPVLFHLNTFDNPSHWTTQSGSGVTYHSPGANSQCNKITTTSCLQLGAGTSVSSLIPTSGYYSISIVIDVSEAAMDYSDWCYLRFKTADTSWNNVNMIRGGDEFSNDITTAISSTYANQSTFTVVLGNGASAIIATEQCYFANLEIYGIPYTDSPTFIPSVSPTFNPTNNPTLQPTNNPTNNPSISPTMLPTYHPSSSTQNPTIPTKNPTKNPTISPTKNPTKNPTISPTKNPTFRPTNGVTEYENEVISITSTATLQLIPKKNKKNENNGLIVLGIVIIVGCILLFCVVMIFIYCVYQKRKLNVEIKMVSSESQTNLEKNVEVNNGDITIIENTSNLSNNNEMDMDVVDDIILNETNAYTAGNGNNMQMEPNKFIMEGRDSVSSSSIGVVTNGNNVITNGNDVNDNEQDILVMDNPTKGIENDEFVVGADTVQ